MNERGFEMNTVDLNKQTQKESNMTKTGDIELELLVALKKVAQSLEWHV